MVAAGLVGTGAKSAFLFEESDPGLPEEVSLELALTPSKSSGTISLDSNGELEGESAMVQSTEINDTEAEFCVFGFPRSFRSSTT